MITQVIKNDSGEIEAFGFCPEFQFEEKRFDNLNAFRKSEGKFYYFSNTPTGRKIARCICEDLDIKPHPELLKEETYEGPLELPPGVKLRSYQEEGIRQNLALKFNGNFYDLGGGKTLTALATIQNLPKGVHLIITKAKCLPIFQQQAKVFGFNFYFFRLEGSNKAKANMLLMLDHLNKAQNFHAVAVCNFESFRYQKDNNSFFVKTVKELKIKFQSCWVDESSALRNNTLFWEGIKMCLPNFQRRYLMSGLPAPQAPSDYVHQFYFLHPGVQRYTSIHAFQKAYSSVNSYTKQREWFLGNEKGMREWHKRVNFLAHVLSTDDMRLELPPIIYRRIPVEMSEEQSKQYKMAVEEGLFEIERKVEKIKSEFEQLMEATLQNIPVKDEFAELMSSLWGPKPENLTLQEKITKLESVKEQRIQSLMPNKIALVTRLQQLTGGYICGFRDQVTQERLPDEKLKENPKLDTLLSFLEDVPKKDKFVVFARFTRELLDIREALENKGYRVYFLDGNKGNTADLTDFLNEDKVDCAVINVASGAYGLNLQAANYEFFFSNSWSVDLRAQALKRCHRPGQDKVVQIIDLTCVGTVDVFMLSKLKKGITLSKAVLNDPDLWFSQLAEEEIDHIDEKNHERQTNSHSGNTGFEGEHREDEIPADDMGE